MLLLNTDTHFIRDCHLRQEAKLLKKWEESNDKLFDFINKKMNTREDAEDILQEVYIKLHENIDSLRDEQKMVSWMYQMCAGTS